MSAWANARPVFFVAMRSSALRALALLMALAALPGAATVQAAEPARVLSREAWIEDGRQATIQDVSTRLAGRFKPDAPGTVYALGPGKTLWLKLRLQGTSAATSEWGLDIPVPLLDYVFLYQRAPDGHWSEQVAGDQIDVASWSRPGRYASFDLFLPVGATRDVYLQVRHRDPIGFNLRLGTSPQVEQRHQFEYLTLGTVLGTLALLVAYCLIQSVIYRDRTFAWYALYGTVMTLTVLAVTGLGGHLVWPQLALWNDKSMGLLPMFLAAVNILFVRNLCAIAPRHPWVDRAVLGVGLLLLLLCIAFPYTAGAVENAIVAFSLLSSLALTVLVASLAWRRGDAVGAWVLFAYLPLTITIVIAMLRLYGFLTASWLSFDGSSVAAAMAVPLLLIAVNVRSRDRHGAMTRVNKLTEQDALTGLLSPAAFERQLKTTVSGAMMRKEAAAVLLVEVANLAEIRRAYGDAMAEQCLLRAVVKLYRVVRDGDPAGRIDTGRFGLIMEGVRLRTELQPKLVQLVASGLAPSRGANFTVPLQFHVSAVLLGERLRTHTLILRDLERLLGSMSGRTRRPIRFLEPDRSGPVNQQVTAAGSSFNSDSLPGASSGGSGGSDSSGGSDGLARTRPPINARSD